MRLELFATAARSDINSRLLTFARPPGPRFRDPRLNTPTTSAGADLIEDVVGLAVRSIVLRRVTEDISANVEIALGSGENVEWQGVGGASLFPFEYRPLANASSDQSLQCV